MKFLTKALIVSIACLISFDSLALPIGFGRNQAPLEYQRISDDKFHVYFDKRAPNEAGAILNSLVKARPLLEGWLGANREKKLPVILSSTTSHASFANFITDALELQTLGDGGRDLSWHELSHNIMYRHLDNILGPTGSILHLPWLPAWWIEGLAEFTSRSVSSDWMFGIERYYALNGNWPSYARLHSLYKSYFATAGYAISGAFVDYIIRTYGSEKLPQLLEDFYHYSMPWWWPVSVVPGIDFMPWDQALRNYTGKSGEELYLEYQQAAEAYWKTRQELNFIDPLKQDDQTKEPDPMQRLKEAEEKSLGNKTGLYLRMGSNSRIKTIGNDSYSIVSYKDADYEVKLIWSEDNQVEYYEKIRPLPEDASSIRAKTDNFQVGVIFDKNNLLENISRLWFQSFASESAEIILERSGQIEQLYLTQRFLYWLERDIERYRLCRVEKSKLISNLTNSDITCILETAYPTRVYHLGEVLGQDEKQAYYVSKIFLGISEETLYGDKSKVIAIDFQSGQKIDLEHNLGGEVINVAEHKGSSYILSATKNHRMIRELDQWGKCIRQYPLADLIMNLQIDAMGNFVLTSWHTHFVRYIKISKSSLIHQECEQVDHPISPLQVALIEDNENLRELLELAHPWKETSQDFNEKRQEKIQNAPNLSHYSSAQKDIEDSAPWHARPVFAFPWIGADALGYQLGAITIPLMDDMQNETLSLSALYGVESRFPNLDLNLTTNRFRNTYSVDAFKRQTWNGVARGRVYYFEEKGASFTAYRYLYEPRISLKLGVKASYLEPYLGDPQIWQLLAQGYHHELNFTASKSFIFRNSSLTTFVNSDIAPQQVNKNFIYDKLALGIAFSQPVSILGRYSSQRFALNYSRTRGKRKKLLREVYRPLRTFVPGSGGGFNEINVSLAGPGALTSAVYGDTQARFEFAWTMPVIRDLEKMLHIFYLERLDFTAFYNAGQAWYGQKTPSKLVQAHGYNLDLQSDIKGVTVNLGLGIGQVFKLDPEVYFLFGFDALINP